MQLAVSPSCRHLRVLLCGVLLCLTAACTAVPRQAEPPGSAGKASISGFKDIRYLVFTHPESVRTMLRQAFVEETPDCYEVLTDGTRVYNYLAVSGGGSDGAFGAGLLNGWTAAGGRPHFKVVTGVSTGALIAPFAFLGPQYDGTLKKAYTTVDQSRVFIVHSLLSILWQESLTDTAPLREMVASFIDDKVLADIAVEHAKGRRLLVASTNLDAEEPVIWDLGAIASSKSKDKLKLFRSILVASAAIPAVFPPVLFEVEVDGRKYDEMHVDGGVFFQSFSIGSIIDLPTTIKAAHPDYSGKFVQRLYVIRNGRITPAPKEVERGLSSIAVRAIGSMFKVSGINDLWRLYLSTIHDEIEFRYIAIPIEYKGTTEQQFNEAEMISQFSYGEKMAIQGIPWMTTPPGYAIK
ncbi:patatin-like phospholipase family protein [Dongia sp.]|uniref:patatin-like phospholipase family protein n=1 Tax=Dongia sp. TaxID=1977262 RepID=UPI0035ADB044